jgi:hypothetical protein
MSLFTSRGSEEVSTIIKMHRSAQQKTVHSQERTGAQYELCRTHRSDGDHLIPVVETSGSKECVSRTLKVV